MPKSNAATVIDLEAFRQRKHEERTTSSSVSAMPSTAQMSAAAFGVGAQALFVPVWFCWVPAWAPVVG